MAAPSNLRVLLAIVASKLRKDRGMLPSPAEMVLTVGDLPPGWSVKGSREWLTGVISPREPWAARARAAGSRTLIVAFASDTSALTTVASQAASLVSGEDAVMLFPSITERMLKNPGRKVEILEREMLILEANIGEERICYRFTTEDSRHPGVRGEHFQLFWRTDKVVALLNLAGEEGTWQASDLAALAAKQDARIRAALAGFSAERAEGAPGRN